MPSAVFIAGRLCGPVLESREEEMFRSGAHGLVVWAASVAAGVLFLLASAGVAVNGAGNIAATFGMTTTHSRATTEAAPTTVAYWADTLLRVPPQAETPAAPASAPRQRRRLRPTVAPEPRKVDPEARAEVTRILTVNALHLDKMSADDRARVVQIVAGQTGVSQADAGQRVDALTTRVNDEAPRRRRRRAKRRLT